MEAPAEARPVNDVPRARAALPPLWKSISGLRGLAMCLVVANHAIQKSGGAFLTAHPRVTPAEMPWAFATIFLIRALTPVCLVLFFFASGFMAFRFFTDARTTRAAAGQLARKYLLWSVAMIALHAFGHDRLSWPEIGTALLLGTAQPAYWFLVVLVALLVSTPVWARLIRQRARWSFLTAAAVQVAACAFFYVLLARGRELSTLELFVLRPLQFLPAFLAGMWASRNAPRLSLLLSGRRRAFLALAVVMGAATLVESWLLGGLAGARAEPLGAVFATERATIAAFGFATIAALLGAEVRRPRLAAWSSFVGTSSLGIMLLMDLCMQAVMLVVWHVPPLLSQGAAAARAQGRLPPGIVEGALWLTPVLFAAGLWGPLWLMGVARRVAGNRVRYLW